MSQADDLPLLPAEEEAALLGALEAALRPEELGAAANERLLALLLEDPLAPASDDELAESARLRDALEQGSAHEDAATLAALRAAFAPPDAAGEPTQAAVQQALTSGQRRRGNVVYAAFGAASVALAAAAVALLLVGTLSRDAAEPALTSAFAKPRSTQPLFSDRFETGDTSARMDAIASARGRDLRGNRYAAWGVR